MHYIAAQQGMKARLALSHVIMAIFLLENFLKDALVVFGGRKQLEIKERNQHQECRVALHYLSLIT